MHPNDPLPQNRLEAAGAIFVGLLLAGIGCGWWIYDADPQHGRVLLVAGLAVAGFGALLRSHRMGRWRRFVVIAAVALLCMVAAFELRDLVELIGDQRQLRPLT